MSLLQNQRGALFGIDARLGLIVFATLSVVAGFYSFSRVKLAKEAAVLRDLTAIETALGAYQADMNTFFLFTVDAPQDDFSDNADQNLTALWDKSQVKPNFQHLWNGPYLHRRTLNHKTYGSFGMSYGQDIREDYCDSRSTCYIWLSLTGVPAKIWTQINRYLDTTGDKTQEVDPHLNGRVQANSNIADTRTLYLRTIKRESQL